ncbi:2TM domain-containing protein [Flavobacterium gilvum]|uniref:2TM domain-containing protein n=1 Tax=Flavobacterium gilvum TaxID=1492737 RepID=A0AAC9I756_9FLAO|nr:2TM domain-containing protein [Flavobacterium gilvum]AOW10942.1 hypothetical protein EM308_16420 [Flavobacterium gilvum]KFC60712.1 hypothetical protein FEM08_04770 [Flavobacterium gilvum]
MGRFRRQFRDELAREHEKHYGKDFVKEFSSEERFIAAYKKVKKIKGFYTHLKIYIIVNVIIIATSLNREIFSEGIQSSGLLEWHTYSTALFWGIGLVAHGLSVFGSDIIFSEDWEQKKIKEFMEKDKSQKWE